MGCIFFRAAGWSCQYTLHRIDVAARLSDFPAPHRWLRLAFIPSRLVSWWGYQNKPRSTKPLLRKGLQRKHAETHGIKLKLRLRADWILCG
jgi:hypothetical protein